MGLIQTQDKESNKLSPTLCTKRYTGQHIGSNPNDPWIYPLTDSVVEAAGLWPIQEYIRRQRDTVPAMFGIRSFS
jgi:hypothetical protein